jgi:hypothetical protein
MPHRGRCAHPDSLIAVAVAAVVAARRPAQEHVPEKVLKLAEAGAAMGCGRKCCQCRRWRAGCALELLQLLERLPLVTTARQASDELRLLPD